MRVCLRMGRYEEEKSRAREKVRVCMGWKSHKDRGEG